MPHTDLKREWRNKAEKEPLYAIAYALMELSDNLDRLGLNRNTETDAIGTTEKIAMALDENLPRLVAAIENLEPQNTK